MGRKRVHPKTTSPNSGDKSMVRVSYKKYIPLNVKKNIYFITHFHQIVCGDTFSLLQPSNVNTAGIIHKIYLENFLCHSSLEIDFNEKINFIIG